MVKLLTHLRTQTPWCLVTYFWDVIGDKNATPYLLRTLIIITLCMPTWLMIMASCILRMPNHLQSICTYVV